MPSPMPCALLETFWGRAILGVLVLVGFGLHGRKLGAFPGAPQNREIPTPGDVQFEPEC